MYTNVGPFHLPRLQRGWQRIRPQEERREPKGRGWGPALALRMLPLLFSPVEVRRAPPLRPFLPSRSSPPFLEVALHGARTDARLIVHGVHGVRRAGQAEPPQATRGTAHGQTHGGQEARLRRPRVPRRPSRRLSRLGARGAPKRARGDRGRGDGRQEQGGRRGGGNQHQRQPRRRRLRREGHEGFRRGDHRRSGGVAGGGGRIHGGRRTERLP